MRTTLVGLLACLSLVLPLTGCPGKNGTSCSVVREADGSATIRCDDGTSVSVPGGRDGASCTVVDQGNGTRQISCTDGTSATVHDGTTCTVMDQGDGGRLISCSDGTSATVSSGTNGTSCTVASDGGVKTISCSDGTTATVVDGVNGSSCTLSDDGAGTKTIRCSDGTSVTVRDGVNAASARVAERHGEAFLAARERASGRELVDAVITAARADATGTASFDFRVTRAGGAPVLDLGAVSATIARLGSIDFAAPSTGEQFTRWVPYLYRTELVSGPGFPRPAGTAALQGWRESNGVLTNHADGTYTYVFATNLSNVTAAGAPVPYLRDKKHRVALMLGGPQGPTATATFDFVPDGSNDPRTRDVVRTSACTACHGPRFSAHSGDRRSVESCATCHVPGTEDAQGGQSLDLRVMIHKIHRGGDLPSVAGPDGNPWLTADNGLYAIWGTANQMRDWRTVAFPAEVNNCSKCHDGTGADSDAWMRKPSIAVCTSCHDTLNITSSATTHSLGPQLNDNNCTVCHGATSGLAPLNVVHDKSTSDPALPLFDARNQPEFTFDVTLTPPANGTDYRGNEAPVVRIVIKRNGTPLPDHRIQSGTAQGCKHTVSTVLCDADTDGRFANTSLFVAGPRARARPVLTTAARAQLASVGFGPFDLSAAGAQLTVVVDQGAALVLPDSGGMRVPGLITAPVSAGTFSSPAAATPLEVVAWLNGNTAFAARALAFLDGGRVWLRSRGRGVFPSIQLQAGPVTTAVFGGDTTVHVAPGFTASNQLTSTDAKVTRYVDRIEYALDPVTDLSPGTYVINLEVAQLGRVSATDYVTPSVLRVPFNVRTATPEKFVAAGCDGCHQASQGPDFDGLVLDPSRHNKIFDATATDQCIACHDYLPQSPTDSSGLGNWTGARPLSRRIHAIHYGSSLNYPILTVDYSNGDPVVGRFWNITFPRPVQECEACHGPSTSATWTNANRLACSGCHDGDAPMAHMRATTVDPTPLDPWSGDEKESCGACH